MSLSNQEKFVNSFWVIILLVAVGIYFWVILLVLGTSVLHDYESGGKLK